jgi:NADPH:quinone reductase-like Zn-dependent oxidoreductase
MLNTLPSPARCASTSLRSFPGRRPLGFLRPGSLLPRPCGLLVDSSLGTEWVSSSSLLLEIWQSVDRRQVLIHAGASGVGIAAIQLARAHGAAAVYTTNSSQEKIDFCVKELGATAGFNYKTQDFGEEVLKATDGHGVDLIIDPVGQSHLQKDINCAARDGAIVLLAMMSGAIVKELNIAPILFKRLRIEGTTLRSRDLEYQRALRDKIVEEALPWITSGQFKVFIEKVFSWKDVSPVASVRFRGDY